MIYLIIACMFWLLVLTFFVVKITNKLSHEHDKHEPVTLENKLKKAVTDVHKKAEQKQPVTLDEAVKQVDEMLAQQSRVDLENWLQKEIKQEASGSTDPTTYLLSTPNNTERLTESIKQNKDTTILPHLNKDYKTY